MTMNNISFNNFCFKYCDGLYDPKVSELMQCTGYLKLKEMVVRGISPASLEEIKRWENNPTPYELLQVPDIKYLRFLHPNLRHYIINNWDVIKNMSVEVLK